VVFLVAGVSAGVALFARRRRRRRQLQLRSCTAGPPRLEVCADSVAAAVAAEEGGADRVELCDSLLEGGTTPSVGKLLCCRRAVSLPVHVMLRPRGGDFLYSPAEIDVIEADLHALKAAGADGVVVGLLRADGRVDEARLRRLVKLAAPLPLTFHRAIDVTPDLVEALHACARCGVARVLTSGGQPCAAQGAATVRQIVETVAAAGYPIVVAAGGGVNILNAAALLRDTGADELHGSARQAVHSDMRYRPDPPIHMGGEKRNGPATEFEWRCAEPGTVAGIVSAMASGGGRPDASITEAPGAGGGREPLGPHGECRTGAMPEPK